MAAALLDHLAAGRVTVRSAGSEPADRANPRVLAAMEEIGLDVSREHPKPLMNRSASPNTTEEWPSEKKKPTPSGRWPSAISLRVVLSIAPMWSASKAWRSPSV